MNIYEKIDYLIDRKGITRKFLCNEIGVSYNTLNSMIKRNSGSISVDTIRDIANFFNVSIDYLMRDEITDPEYGTTIDFAVTLSEQSLIKKYRTLDEHGKKAVDLILNHEHDRISTIKINLGSLV